MHTEYIHSGLQDPQQSREVGLACRPFIRYTARLEAGVSAKYTYAAQTNYLQL